MQRSKIEWCTHTDNIMVGCPNGCPYCYARKLAERFSGSKAFPTGFRPTFHPDRLNGMKDFKRPALVFQGSMTDFFSYVWTEKELDLALNAVKEAKQHQIVILTKVPEVMLKTLEKQEAGDFSHVYFGTSVTGKAEYDEIERLKNLKRVRRLGYKTVISFEPLLHDPKSLIECAGGIEWTNWIIVGGQTNPNIFPKMSWLVDLILSHQEIPVFQKDNTLRNPVKGNEWENYKFPVDLKKIADSWKKR